MIFTQTRTRKRAAMIRAVMLTDELECTGFVKKIQTLGEYVEVEVKQAAA